MKFKCGLTSRQSQQATSHSFPVLLNAIKTIKRNCKKTCSIYRRLVPSKTWSILPPKTVRTYGASFLVFPVAAVKKDHGWALKGLWKQKTQNRLDRKWNRGLKMGTGRKNETRESEVPRSDRGREKDGRWGWWNGHYGPPRNRELILSRWSGGPAAPLMLILRLRRLWRPSCSSSASFFLIRVCFASANWSKKMQVFAFFVFVFFVLLFLVPESFSFQEFCTTPLHFCVIAHFNSFVWEKWGGHRVGVLQCAGYGSNLI